MPVRWKLMIIFSIISLLEVAAEDKLEVKVLNLKKFDITRPLHLALDKNVQYVIQYSQMDTPNPYRVEVVSHTASIMHPILVVVRQQKQILSWEVPLCVETSTRNVQQQFSNTSRTMCHNDMDQLSLLSSVDLHFSHFFQNFVVELSTASPKRTTATVVIYEETKFFVQENEIVSLVVSPSQPRYVYYKFKHNVSDTFTIEINSDDDICLVVSVQDSNCPVFDLNEDIRYKGKYQTISRKGGLTIRRKDFTNGFFLVFVAKPDNYECTAQNSMFPGFLFATFATPLTASNVSFTIKEDLHNKEYFVVSLITMAAIAIFYALTILLVVCFRKWGSISKIRLTPQQRETLAEDQIDVTYPRSRLEISYILERSNLNVKNLTRYPLRDKKKSFSYLWQVVSIAIFYSIPVVQLVITYQRMVNVTGNEDLCYYNFLCAHPLFSFSDFNHIFSNIGYIFMGILFLLVTLHRQTVDPFRYEVGIPVHYGIYYSMGVALIIEGLLSACYHICPSQSNYQFDTSFMYIMAVLCMVKLYQNRHPDINATANATFSVLGIAIFMAMIGILNNNFTIWIVFVVNYTCLCFYISFKIYFLGFVFNRFSDLKKEVVKNMFNKEMFIPVKKARFFVLLFANIINIGMMVAGLFLYSSQLTDFGTFLLGLLMANAVLHAVFYTSMKIIYKERICFEAICYGILALITWIVATIFFLDNATLWTVAPAESRQWNQECILLNYYDKHDVWHFLSAPALFFTFMFLMCLDDDIIDRRQEDIPVF